MQPRQIFDWLKLKRIPLQPHPTSPQATQIFGLIYETSVEQLDQRFGELHTALLTGRPVGVVLPMLQPPTRGPGFRGRNSLPRTGPGPRCYTSLMEPLEAPWNEPPKRRPLEMPRRKLRPGHIIQYDVNVAIIAYKVPCS